MAPGRRRLIRRLHRLLDRLEPLLPVTSAPPPDGVDAYRVHGRDGRIEWLPVRHPHRIGLADLLHMERQQQTLVRNTAQFVAGRSANNALLWGARGTGKSSLVKALFNAFRDQGLRLLEVEPHDLGLLPELIERIDGRPERWLLFCDDLSFEAEDASFTSLKAVLDGSIVAPPDNLLIYATSNRRHLMPEFQRENLEARRIDDEIHPGEAVEEKVSLSDRFGLWLAFHPFSQAQYLAAVHHWLARLGAPATDPAAIEAEALRWALLRGSRSGRIAHQFARDRAGRID